jgi:hypothetical protein
MATWLAKDNVIHRDDDLPALVGVSRKDRHAYMDEDVVQRAKYLGWMLNGIQHRDRGMPAEVWTHSSVREAYWVHGKRHRELPLPAVVYADGTGDLFDCGEYKGTVSACGKVLSFYRNRQECAGDDLMVTDHVLHREPDQGPARTTYADYIFGRVVEESYYVDNQLSRTGDLPAVYNWDTRVKEYWLRGFRHREKDLPAVVDEFNRHYEWWFRGYRHRLNNQRAVDRGVMWEYYVLGKPHREDGPWSSKWPGEWRLQGHLHAPAGKPAVNTEWLTEYRSMGMLYNLDGPAKIEIDPQTLQVLSSWYMVKNKMYRPIEDDDAPAFVVADKDGRICHQAWYHRPGVVYREDDRPSRVIVNWTINSTLSSWTALNGLISRRDGPALVLEIKGKVHSAGYYLNGVKLTRSMHGRVMSWVKRARGRYKEEESQSRACSMLLPIKSHLFNLLA